MPPRAHATISRRLRISNTNSPPLPDACAPPDPSPHSPGTSALGEVDLLAYTRAR